MQPDSGERAARGLPHKIAVISMAHRVAGIAAILIILAFQGVTIVVELAFDTAVIAAVKTAIWYTIPLLVLAMAMAGGSGNWLASGNASAVVKRKRRRLALAAANGLLVLIPSAYALQRWANAGNLGAGFYGLQVLELAAGLANLVLLIGNALDGWKLARGRRDQSRMATVGTTR